MQPMEELPCLLFIQLMAKLRKLYPAGKVRYRIRYSEQSCRTFLCQGRLRLFLIFIELKFPKPFSQQHRQEHSYERP